MFSSELVAEASIVTPALNVLFVRVGLVPERVVTPWGFTLLINKALLPVIATVLLNSLLFISVDVPPIDMATSKSL